MIEYKPPWNYLLRAIEDHQTSFKEQLAQLLLEDTVPDQESPLLPPIIQYLQ
jgi:hypothetical protein